MKKHRITSPEDALYASFKTLYESAFPVYEKRTESHQRDGLKDDRFHLDCYLDDNQLIGFFGYWQFAQYCYIEHYAINGHIRGKGYGTQLLQQFLDKTDNPVILEIDPLTDEISRKRLRFYQQLGFVENPYHHAHPAYKPQFQPHELIVLSSHSIISPELYQQFVQDLDEVVMKMSG